MSARKRLAWPQWAHRSKVRTWHRLNQAEGVGERLVEAGPVRNRVLVPLSAPKSGWTFLRGMGGRGQGVMERPPGICESRDR